MNSNFIVLPHTIHLWRVPLQELTSDEQHLLSLLSPDEVQRADRFHFPIHRQRFIIARATLRRILSLYMGLEPEEIVFEYGPHSKPYLQDKAFDLQFNLSHSHDIAVYALTKQAEIGVDIEKIEDFKEDIAKRFFSPEEVAQLMQLPAEEKCSAFYTIWACKEAVIKTFGKGLYTSLADFSVSAQKKIQSINLKCEQKNDDLHLESFLVHPDYRAAFATNQMVEGVFYWQWLGDGCSVWDRL